MKSGDHIYYIDKNGDSFPGIILSIKKRIRIKINHFDGDLVKYVSESNLIKQDDN